MKKYHSWNYLKRHICREITHCRQVDLTFTPLLFWPSSALSGTMEGVWGKGQEAAGRGASEEDAGWWRRHRGERKQVWPAFPAAWSLNVRTQVSSVGEGGQRTCTLAPSWSPKMRPWAISTQWPQRLGWCLEPCVQMHMCISANTAHLLS